MSSEPYDPVPVLTPITVYLDIGSHKPANVAWSIEKTLKAVAKDRMNNDDADAVFDLQNAYLIHYKIKGKGPFAIEDSDKQRVAELEALQK